MKIEIDLNDIIGDEYGAETLQESVKRQVLQYVTDNVLKTTKRQIEEETSRVINETLRTTLVEKMPTLLEEVLNAEYTPVNTYGQKGIPTTFKHELINEINNNMVYKKTTYPSDKNAFTKAVDSVVDTKLNEFKSLWLKTVDRRFLEDAMAYATNALAERLNLKVK
jgi:hypothetical protein